MAICKLCKQDKKLLKKSHIIPEFMYNGMFDEEHKIVLTPAVNKSRDSTNTHLRSTGEYESNILCLDCDNKLLGEYYENYASRVLYGGRLNTNECPEFSNTRNTHGIEFIKCTKVNYHKFKLFLLSVLWRASISQRPFFSEVRLNDHEERIRNMILTKDAGDATLYPINIFTYRHIPQLTSELISQPRYLKTKEGLEYYSILINGYFYFYYLSNPDIPIPKRVVEITITTSNELQILKLPPDKGIDFIAGQFGIKPGR
jgi:hypothetical protein